MARLVSKIYGEALFDFAKECGQLEKMCEEAYDVASIFSTKDIKEFVNSPTVTKEEKIAFVNELFTKKLWAGPVAKLLQVFKIDITKGENPKILDFLAIVIEKGRHKEIVAIMKHFITLTLEAKNIGEAEVTTAIELSSEQKKALEEKITSATKYEYFVVDYKIDKDLIAGMKIKIGDKVFDKSYKTKISDISKSLRGLKI